MISFDALTLKALINEQSEFLTGARINKIQQPTRREFVFNLRNFGLTKLFYININPQFYHVCFITKETFDKRLLEIPAKPPMFCMLLRKYLENSRIAKVNVVENERILEFYIETYNEVGEKVYLCLAMEFMGKHSNVILYNYDTNIIIGCAHNVGAEKSREREIYGSLPYAYPPKQSKNNIADFNGEFDYINAPNDFYMISQSFADKCKGLSINKVKDFLNLKNLTPSVDKDFKEYSLYSELLGSNEGILFDSVNDMIDEYYSYHIAQNKFSVLKSQYKTIVSQRLKKANKAIKQMNYKLLSDSDCDKYRLWGDLLMANLYNLKDYSSNAEVYDYENNLQITIALDKLKTIKENANKFYKLYNKAKVARNKLTELSEEYSVKVQYLGQLLYSINSAQNINDLFEISDEIEDKKTNYKGGVRSSEIHRIVVDEGTSIYIGKNNKQNDYIISKIANEEDFWFHVKSNAGSHVLLKTTGELTDELIFKCANLAKEYSSVSNSSKIGVIYTKRKYLRKPPSANLGYVTYRNEKEIVLD